MEEVQAKMFEEEPQVYQVVLVAQVVEFFLDAKLGFSEKEEPGNQL